MLWIQISDDRYLNESKFLKCKQILIIKIKSLLNFTKFLTHFKLKRKPQ